MVRNLNILGLSLSAFKEIVAVPDAPFVYTAPFRPRRVSPLMSELSFNPGLTLVSVAVPSLLLDELTLQRPTGEVPNLPFHEASVLRTLGIRGIQESGNSRRKVVARLLFLTGHGPVLPGL